MPYEIRQSAKGHCVHKQGDSGPALGCHKSKSAARRQVKALYASEAETMKAGRYDGIDFSPPESVRAIAAAGLAKRREFGRGGTEVGIARARDLSGGTSISPDTARRMVSFFARHEIDKQASGFSAGEPGYPSNGRIAWELWGGDAGRAWASKLVGQMESAETNKEHTGVMIALLVPEKYHALIADLQAMLPRGTERVPVEEAHVTLLYLGDASEIERLKRQVYVGALNSLEWQNDIPAKLTGLARFNGSEEGRNPLVLLVDSPMLPGFRQRLFSLLTDRGVPDNQRHGFIPHITLGYIPTDAKTPQIEVPQEQIVFDSLVVAWGDEHLVVPLSGAAAYKAEGKGYGARAGEVISGNLVRGTDGKFGSAGNASTATPADAEKPATIRRQRLGRTAAANEERKRQARDAKRRATATESERKRQARARATEQRKRERAARREAEKKRRAEEKQRQIAANRKAALDATGVSDESMRALEDFAKGGELEFDSELADVLVSMGLVTPTGPGRDIYKMGAAGKAFLAAAKKGDIRQAKDAIANGRETVRKRREARKRELEREKEAGLSVFKDASGRYRWLLLSSNAYRDRDGEIVSIKALAQDVARADTDGDYGPLRWWHVPGLDIGDCDFNAMSGRVLVESGTFRSEAIGRAVFKAQANLQASIGFRHPVTEPDHEKVYHNIRRFERSLTPVGRASNPFTRLIVKQGGTMEGEKIQALKALLGEDAVNGIIAQVQATQKAADAAGVAFKEAPEVPVLTIARSDTVTSDSSAGSTLTLTPRDVANIVTAPNDSANSIAPEPEEEDESEDARIYAGDLEPGELVSLLSAGVAQALAPLMHGVTEAVKSLGESRVKSDDIALIQEQQARKALEDTQARAAIQQQMTALETALKEAKDALAELTGEQPRALQQGGYRASQASDTIPQTTALKSRQPEGFDPNFVADFLLGANSGLPPQ